MKELLEVMQHHLDTLPSDHPERAEVEEEVISLQEQTVFRRLDELKEAQPPERVLEVLENAKKRYGDMYEAIAVPTITLRETTRYPQGWVHLDPSFFQMLKQGKIQPEDAATISQAWLLWDKTTRPNFHGGEQLYENGNDPLSEELARLRRRGAIKIFYYNEHVPKTSRFGISPIELDRAVFPLHAENLKIRPDLNEQVTACPYSLFNFIGNWRHPELGEVNTGEWMNEKFEGGISLFGGCSIVGGLAHVYYNTSDYHLFDLMGFRPLVAFPLERTVQKRSPARI